LIEDLLEEIKDFEAEWSQMVDDKRSKEASLVAGGKVLREKATQQILGGEPLAIGGSEPTLLRHSPASSVSGVSDGNDMTNPSTASSKKRRAHEHFFFDLAELTQHQEEMRLQFLKFEQRLKNNLCSSRDISITRNHSNDLIYLYEL
jgi:hypothetical protein